MVKLVIHLKIQNHNDKKVLKGHKLETLAWKNTVTITLITEGWDKLFHFSTANSWRLNSTSTSSPATIWWERSSLSFCRCRTISCNIKVERTFICLSKSSCGNHSVAMFWSLRLILTEFYSLSKCIKPSNQWRKIVTTAITYSFYLCIPKFSETTAYRINFHHKCHFPN